MLSETADVRLALQHLEPLREKQVLDLGGGLGLHAVLLATRGARVLVADLSLTRLKEARIIAAEFGVADRISFVCCAAEELPFARGAFDCQLTKSVLIHTELEQAAREMARTLKPGGKAAFIEPLSNNPFVRLYRRIAAPKIWAEITRYFNDERLAQLRKPFRLRGARVTQRRLFFLAFFATPLNYSLHAPRAYRAAEVLLCFFDAILFALVPPLRGAAWFAVMLIEMPRRRRR